jgi:transcription antitermination factor NusG
VPVRSPVRTKSSQTELKVAKKFAILQTFAKRLRFRPKSPETRTSNGARFGEPSQVSQSGFNFVTQRGGALAISNISGNSGIANEAKKAAWFAIQTRSKHERVVSNYLANRGVTHYLPTLVEVRRWSDRRKKVECPLFPGYLFVEIIAENERRVEVLRAPGMVRFVGPGPEGTAIPSCQIESVKKLVDQNLPWTTYPFLKSGQRVRLRGGALDRVEGIFLRRGGEGTLVVSIDAIQRSLAVSVQGYDLEVI